MRPWGFFVVGIFALGLAPAALAAYPGNSVEAIATEKAPSTPESRREESEDGESEDDMLSPTTESRLMSAFGPTSSLYKGRRLRLGAVALAGVSFAFLLAGLIYRSRVGLLRKPEDVNLPPMEDGAKLAAHDDDTNQAGEPSLPRSPSPSLSLPRFPSPQRPPQQAEGQAPPPPTPTLDEYSPPLVEHSSLRRPNIYNVEPATQEEWEEQIQSRASDPTTSMDVIDAMQAFEEALRQEGLTHNKYFRVHPTSESGSHSTLEDAEGLTIADEVQEPAKPENLPADFNAETFREDVQQAWERMNEYTLETEGGNLQPSPREIAREVITSAREILAEAQNALAKHAKHYAPTFLLLATADITLSIITTKPSLLESFGKWVTTHYSSFATPEQGDGSSGEA